MHYLPKDAQHLLDGKLIDLALWKPKHFKLREYAEKYTSRGTTLLTTPSSIVDTLQFLNLDIKGFLEKTPCPGKPFTWYYHEMIAALILLDEGAYMAEQWVPDSTHDIAAIHQKAAATYMLYTNNLTAKLKMKL